MEKSDLQDGIIHTEEFVQTGCTQPPRARPRPGRRRKTRYLLGFSFAYTVTFTLLVLLSCCCGTIHAASAETRASRTQKALASFVSRELVFDARPAPQPPLYRRAEASSIAAPVKSNSKNAAAASSTTSGSSPTSIESAPIDSTAPLPQPFDGGLGTNYTQPSCPTFLKSMINNDTFTSCLPFSLLLQNSMSFFTATKSLSSITDTLTASCTINFQICSSLLSSFAHSLRSTSACSQDYRRENPIVRQAYAGLLSYDVLYHASCLKDPSQDNGSSNYCFANAVTNLSSPTDSYPYYLPLGIPMPASSLPTCNECLKDTMAVFATAASNKSQPLNLDYVTAAQQIARDCGPGFVNETIPDAGASGSGGGATSAAVVVGRPGWVLLVSVVMAIGVVGL